MKKLKRTLALFLALAMTFSLSVTAFADEEEDDGPKLVWNWLDWSEEGFFASDDALSPEGWSDTNPSFDFGQDMWGFFSVVDGEKKTPVAVKNLKATGASLEAAEGLDGDVIAKGAKKTDCYVLLRLDNWDGATVTTTYNKKDVTIEITAQLPGYTLYTEPKFEQDAYVGNNVNLLEVENDTVYFGSWLTIEENDEELVNVEMLDDITGLFTVEQENDNFWKITMDREAIEVRGWTNLRLAVTTRNSDGETNINDGFWFNFSVQYPEQLWSKWLEWDQYCHPNNNNWFDEGLSIHPGEEDIRVFYTAEEWDDDHQPIKPQPVKAADLVASEGVTITPFVDIEPDSIAKDDPLRDCYAKFTVDEFDKVYTISCGDATMGFNSYLPDLAVYDVPERTAEHYVINNGVPYGVGHMDAVYYIISASDFSHHGRVVDSLTLAAASEENINDLVVLEEVSDGVCSIRFKDGTSAADVIGRDTNMVTADITWRDQDGNTWPEEGAGIVWYDYYPVVMVSEESILDGTKESPNNDYKLYSDVADKLSDTVTMTAGEDKTFYLAAGMFSLDDDDQFVPAVIVRPSAWYTTSDDALTLTVDSVDGAKYTLSCDEPGEYEIGVAIAYCYAVDENGEPIVDPEEDAAIFGELDENGLGWAIKIKENSSIFFDVETLEEVEAPFETTVIPGTWDEQYGYTIKVIVEDSTPVTELFSDISETDWFVTNGSVKFVSSKGWINGDNGRFKPNDNIPGTEFVQIMYNISGKPEAAADAAFAGVDSQWYAPAILWAAGENLITDTGDGALVPTDNLTREQMIVILYNMVGEGAKVEADLSVFPDADQVSPWALDAVNWAVSNGVIGGMNGMLNPSGTTVRSNVATMLMNYYSK